MGDEQDAAGEERVKSQEKSKAFEAFANLVEHQAESMRNLVGLSALDLWITDLVDDKVSSEPVEANGEESLRARKMRGWAKTVARRRMVRFGTSLDASPEDLERLSVDEAWIGPAIRAGKKLSVLTLGEEDSDELRSIMDWMRSQDGPRPDSDWSRISWTQATEAHQKWIKALIRAAEKKIQDSNAFDGCTLWGPISDTPELEGWTWVEVKSAAALNREGVLMKHCVGSYADAVSTEKVRIGSLRDSEGNPHLTVEAVARNGQEGLVVRQIKGAANSSPKRIHLMALPSMVDGFKLSTGLKLAVPGYLLGNGAKGLNYAPEGFGQPGRLWRHGHPSDARAAVQAVEAFEKDSSFETCLAVLEFLSKSEYVSAGSIFMLKGKVVLAQLVSDVMAERIPSTVKIPDGATRKDLLFVRDRAAERGLGDVVSICMDALRRAPDSEYKGEAHKQISVKGLERFEACLALSNAFTKEIKRKVKMGSLGNPATATKQDLKASVSLKKLAKLLGSSRNRTVHAISGYLCMHLAKEVPEITKFARPGILKEAGVVSNRFHRGFSLMNEFIGVLSLSIYEWGNFDSSGRKAMISGISGMGSLNPQQLEQEWASEEQELMMLLNQSSKPDEKINTEEDSGLKGKLKKGRATKLSTGKPAKLKKTAS